MKKYNYNLIDFDEDVDHFPEIEMLLTVKSFDLEAIRKRYLESKNRNKAGSIARRSPAIGGLVYFNIKKGQVVKTEIISELIEPRGIDIHSSKLALSSEREIYIFEKSQDKPLVLRNKWLSYIHSIRFNENASKLLVSSSGVDSLIEFDLKTGAVFWEWLAWENELNEGENPETGEKHYLTRSEIEAEKIEKSGKKSMLLIDPEKQKLPTALRAAFINSAEYRQNGNLLATLFHHGHVIEISKQTGKWHVLLDGLSKPHGGVSYKDGCFVTDTGNGRVIIKQKNEFHEYYFGDLPGKPDNLKTLEWLQFSKILDNIFVTIDSNRNSVLFIDYDNKKKMTIKFNPNWAIQEFTFLNEFSLPIINKLKLWFKDKGPYIT